MPDPQSFHQAYLPEQPLRSVCHFRNPPEASPDPVLLTVKKPCRWPHPSRKPHIRQIPIPLWGYLSGIPCCLRQIFHWCGYRSSWQSMALIFSQPPQRMPDRFLLMSAHPYPRNLSSVVFPDCLPQSVLRLFPHAYSAHLRSLQLPFLQTQMDPLNNTRNFFRIMGNVWCSLPVPGSCWHSLPGIPGQGFLPVCGSDLGQSWMQLHSRPGSRLPSRSHWFQDDRLLLPVFWFREVRLLPSPGEFQGVRSP